MDIPNLLFTYAVAQGVLIIEQIGEKTFRLRARVLGTKVTIATMQIVNEQALGTYEQAIEAQRTQQKKPTLELVR